jgi:hypothetical protein
VEWTESSSPSKTIYATAAFVTGYQDITNSLPPNNTPYNNFDKDADRNAGTGDTPYWKAWH